MAALVEAQTSGIWFDRSKVEEAEYKYQEYLVRGKTVKGDAKKVQISGGSVSQQIAEARQQIKESLNAPSVSNDSDGADLRRQVETLTLENKKLNTTVTKLTERLGALESRLAAVEKKSGVVTSQPDQPAEKPAQTKEQDDDDDSDIDFFGSDSEDEEERERIKAERVAAYNERKQKKPAVIAKSTIILDVKPWDDETDMGELEKAVRSIECDGLRWGASKFVKVAFGIMKLQINCIVEDDKVGTDFLEEEITGFEDYVQSVDVVAFNKI